MNWKSISIRASITATCLLSLTQIGMAQIRGRAPQWATESGDLTLTVTDRWGRSCASGTAMASYQVRNGSQGLLYPTDCDAGADAARDNIGLYRFEDISGAERCIGSMSFESMTSGSSTVANTTWVIERSVPGFTCSTVGATYNVQLFHLE